MQVVGADPGLAQGGAHVLHQIGDLLLAHGRNVDLEQQIGAALQVETEVQGVLRQPARQGLALRRAQQIRVTEQQAEDERGGKKDDLPA